MATTETYYATVAQVLPLLFVTVMVEHGLLRQALVVTRWKVVDVGVAAFTGVTSIFLAISEAEVLYALRRAAPPEKIDDDVRAALILTGMALVLPVALRVVSVSKDLDRDKRVLGGIIGAIVAMVAWVAAGLLSR